MRGSPPAISYGRRLSMLAAEHPETAAVVFAAENGTETVLAWQQLERRSNQVARLLEERGLREKDVVAVALHNSPEHLFSTFAAWKLGASVLPLRWDLPGWERDRVLRVADARVVVAGWRDSSPGTITREDIGATVNEDAAELEDHVPEYTRLIATSGATGTPKIVAIAAPGVMEEDETVSTVLGRQTGKRYLTTSPLYHVNGWSYCYNPLLQDCQTVLMERFDAARAVELIQRYDIHFACMVPTMLIRVARLPGVASRSFSSIERIVCGGASAPEWVVRAWLDLVPPERFTITYGGSENHGLVMTTGDAWLEHPGTVGKPVNAEIKIVDEQGQEVHTGEIGEIRLKNLMRTAKYRYIGIPTPAPDSEGFESFGDMGWADDDGFVYIADRRLDMIVTGGANVYPAEVEAVLSEHPGVLDVVVIGLPDPEWGHRVTAVIEAVDAAAPPTPEELRAYCKDRLVPYKVPKSFTVVEGIPRTAAGKVSRSRLADDFRAAAAAADRSSQGER